MVRRTYTPGPPLAAFVEHLWLLDGYRPAHAFERVMPTASMELVVNLRDDRVRVYDRPGAGPCRRLRGALICGAHVDAYVIDTAQQASIMGVHFRPGGAFPFLGVAAHELGATHVSLEDLWGPAAQDLRDRLVAASTPREKFRRLELALVEQAKRPLVRRRAVAVALDAFSQDPGHPVGAVVPRVGLSHRRFIEVFRAEIGLAPKQFCRLQRFRKAMLAISTVARVRWSDVVFAAGYCDQAHLSREFRAFSGLAPTSYARRRGETADRVPIEV